jgi:hypothetical protein
MSQTYSTRQRETEGGRYYSSLQTPRVSVPFPGPSAPTPASVAFPAGTREVLAAHLAPATPQVAVAAPVGRESKFNFTLSGQGLPNAQKIAPGATGSATVTGHQGGSYSVTSTITGPTRLPDPALQPTFWLIHDLAVPRDLPTADLTRLPQGRSHPGNQPDSVFTLDGNPPTYGPTFLQQMTPPAPIRGGGVCFLV